MPGFVFGAAEGLKVALIAFGIAGEADLAAMLNDLEGEADPAVARENLHQLLLDFFRGVGFGEFEAARDAEDMRVDDDALGLAERDAEDDVGGFASDAGDGGELGEGLRHLAVEVGDDLAGRALDGLGLVVVEAGGADELFELGEFGLGHCGRRGESPKELGRDHVHAGVGTLRGEDGRDQKLPWRAMVERADGVGIGFVEGFEDRSDALSRQQPSAARSPRRRRRG